MSSSWRKFRKNCKSRLSAIARSLFFGRDHWLERFEEAKEELNRSRKEIITLVARCEKLEEEAIQLRERNSELERGIVEAKPVKSVEWPVGEAPPEQQFGASMIALCVNLAREIGLRPVVRVLNIFSEWMNVSVRIPTYQAIRGWMQRIGLDRMTNAKKTSGGAWFADHTIQIGKEKVLAILRLSNSQLPRRSVPLCLEDVEVLSLVPGIEWKREAVLKVYQSTVEFFGLPRVVESDGAVELWEPVENLGNSRKKPIVIRDPKHFMANRLEALLTNDPDYQEFCQKLSWARSALPQTELAHFIPPGFKAKSRFMNLASTLNWAAAMLWHLEHPGSRSRQGITKSRVEEKMGWLRGFTKSTQKWRACQEVVSVALTFSNKQGIFRGASKELQKLVEEIPHDPMSRKLVSDIAEFFRQHEEKLLAGERLPMSTEILESSFSRYKQFEKQHSKNGFTSLLLTYPVLLRKTTPEEVKESFARTRIRDVQAWVNTNMPSTLTSKRQLFYREAKKSDVKTEKRATTETAAA